MKTKKLRLVSALLAVAMLLTLLPVGVFAEESSTTLTVNTETEFTSAITTVNNNPETAYTISLNNDITLSSGFTLNAGTRSTIQSNGKTLMICNGVLTINDEATLTLDSVTITTNDRSKAYLISVKGTLKMQNSSCINGAQNRACIYAQGQSSTEKASVEMQHSSSIVYGNTNSIGSSYGYSPYAGGITLSNATLVMDGSSIYNCESNNYGGGVRVDDNSTLTLNNSSSIYSCTALTGGGVSVHGSNSCLLMNHPSTAICNNHAQLYASDLFISESADCHITLQDPAGSNRVFGDSSYKINGWYHDNSGSRYSSANAANAIQYSVPAPNTEIHNEALSLVAAYKVLPQPTVDNFEFNSDAKKVSGKNNMADDDIEKVIVNDGSNDITINGNDLSSLTPGHYTIVSVTTRGNSTYDAGTVTMPNTNGWKFTIKYNLSASDFTFAPPTDLVYDGTAKTANVATTKNAGDITIKYYDEKGNAVTPAPTNPGTYTVKIDAAGSDEYQAGTDITDESWTFTILKKKPTADDFVFDADQKLGTADGVEGMGDLTSVTVKDADGNEHTLPEGSTRYLKPGEYTITTVTVAEGELYAAGDVDVSSRNWTFNIPDTTVPGGDDNDSTNPGGNGDNNTPTNPDDNKPAAPDDKNDTPNTPSNPDDNTPSKPDDGTTTPDDKPDNNAPSNPDDSKSDSEPDNKPEEPETEYPISGNDDAEVAVADPDGNARADGKSQAGDTVTITLPEEKRTQGDMVFDGWVLDVQPSEVNAEDVLKELVANGYQPGEPETSFTMPELPEGTQLSFRPHYVTPDQAGQSDDSFLLTAAAVTGGAVLTGIVVWQGYNLFAQEYLKANLPAGTAIPQDRAQLALLLWDEAHDPAPANSTLYTDVSADDANAQAAARWTVENELLAPADKNDANLFAPNKSVSVGQVYRAWKKVQALK